MANIPFLPFVVSTSGYNHPDVDWGSPIIDPPVAAVIGRASLGTPEFMGSVTRATDQSFPHYWPQWDRLRMCRGAYPFFYNGIGAADQARWFVNRVMAAGGFHPCDRVVLDAEIGANLSLREIVDFFYNMTVLVPYVPVKNFLLYSRRNLLDPLNIGSLNDAQRALLRQIFGYPAGYPDDPTQWDWPKLVHAYQYDQTKYGPAKVIQYQASAVVPGISMPGFESVECNAIDLEYMAAWRQEVDQFYGTVTVPGDIVTEPYEGVKVTTGRRFDSDIRMVVISNAVLLASKPRVVLYSDTGCKSIQDVAGDIVTNGGDFDMTTCKPVGLLNSNGTQFSPQADFEPALGFDMLGYPEIDHIKSSWPNAVGLKRYLVVNGAVNPTTSDAWNNREPRTIFGINGNRDLMILSVKGRQPDQAGLDLFQCASVMIEFGAYVAGDGDGGDSVQSRVAGEIFLGTQTPRVVADFVSINIQAPGGNPMANYKCTVIWDGGASIRPEPSTSNNAVGLYSDNSVFYASELVPDADDPNNTAKVWARVESDPINGTKWAGKFVAVKYPASSGAVDRCTVEDLTAPPPPPPPGGAVIDHFEAVYTDGTRQTFIPAP